MVAYVCIMTLNDYVEIDIMSVDGRHEFHRKRLPDEMGCWTKEAQEFAIKFAQEWFRSIVVAEDAIAKLEKETGHLLNLPKRRLLYTAVMRDHYNSPDIVWQKKFDKVN